MVIGRWFLWTYVIGILFSPIYAIVLLWFVWSRVRRWQTERRHPGARRG